MICGIVLAGGQSRRMGRPKALLRAGADTFLERAVRLLRQGGCDDVVVVLNAEDPIRETIATRAGGRVIRGEGRDSEQIDSLRAGLKALPRDTEAAVALPVDHPRVEPRTVSRLIEAFRSRRAPVILVSHGGEHGHPVLFSSQVFGELLAGKLPEGARSVIHRHDGDVEVLEVDDPGVLIDVDTPADYRSQREGDDGQRG